METYSRQFLPRYEIHRGAEHGEPPCEFAAVRRLLLRLSHRPLSPVLVGAMAAKATSLAGLHRSTLGLGAGAVNADCTRLLLPQTNALKYYEINSVHLHRVFDLPEDGPFALAGSMAKADREAAAAAKVLDVTGREFSFSGHLGVTLMDDMSFRLTETTPSREMAVMESENGGHDDFVNACALSSDAEFAISASSDRTLRRWETLTGFCTHTYEGHAGAVRGVDIHPNDAVFFSASTDKSIRLWDVRRTAPRSAFLGHRVRTYVQCTSTCTNARSGCSTCMHGESLQTDF